MTRLRLLIGAPASGKSTLCCVTSDTVLSLDDARARFGRHVGDQQATAPAVAHVAEQLVTLLREGQPVTLDATNVTDRDRAPWLGIARAFSVPAESTVLETDLDTCQARNAQRDDPRRVPADIVERMWRDISGTTDDALRCEGIVHVHRIVG